MLRFQILQTHEELLQAYPLMHQLREHLSSAEFIKRTQAAQNDSRYVLVGCFESGLCIGLMGYRILTDLVHGRHLYIDDLVVDQGRRSKGIGAQLLEQAQTIARQENCKRLRLCTGNDNAAGKKFYERLGWQQRAVVYKLALD